MLVSPVLPLVLPRSMRPLMQSFGCAFTRPSFDRFVVLCVAAIVTSGRRTVSRMIRTVGCIAPGEVSAYHGFFSRRRWSCWMLGKVLATLVLERLDEGQPVVLAVDDTVAGHKGPKVYGRCCHRDPTRSSHARTALRWGHRWVVLAVLVKFPFAPTTSRPWALPVLAALYRNRDYCAGEGRRFRSPAQLGRQLTAVLIHWFPDRRFILLGDGGYASHELARFCHRHRRHVTLVSRFYDDAELYARPRPRKLGRGRGRRPIKGVRLPRPGDVAATIRPHPTQVRWYGGSDRRVALLSACGLWYRTSKGCVPVRWVFVRDVQGTHRDEFFFATDPTLRPGEIVSLYTQRWSLEVTFQEVRAHLGFETTRQRVKNSVLRTGPCLLGLFSLVSLAYARHFGKRPANCFMNWRGKQQPSFADALVWLRRQLWTTTLLSDPSFHDIWRKIPRRLRLTLTHQLSLAA